MDLRFGGVSVLVGTALVAVAFACGGEETVVDTEGATVRIEEGGDQVRIEGKTEEGQAYAGSFGGDVELPADFPKDVPLPPEGRLVGVMSAPGEGRMITLQTDEAPATVYDFYQKRLSTDGWSIGADMNLGGQRMLSAEKGGRTAAVQIVAGEDGTQVVLTLNEDG